MTKNFRREEFACKCACGLDGISPVLVDTLQRMRDDIGKPIVVNSGVRCAKHNAEVGGEPNSYHLKGMAADIRVADMKPATVAAVAMRYFRGVGIYRTFVHVDIRRQRTVFRGH